MPLFGLCASHTPLKDFLDPDPGVAREVAGCLATVRSWVAKHSPDLVVVFGPDHFNGFFYRLMPSFCVGAVAESVGDWGIPAAPLPVATSEAEALVSHLHRQGVDAAISYQMEVDHGLSQILAVLFEGAEIPPVVPVFINCAAPPRPPIARVIALGKAVGEYLAGRPLKTLVLGSGGLSHDPPMPVLAAADPAVRRRIVEGGRLGAEARRARETSVLEEGLRQLRGESPAIALNPAWDREILGWLSGFDFDALTALRDEDISREGGCGGHEIRSWIATAAAMQAQAGITASLDFYRPIPVWVAGFGVMRFGAGQLG